MISSMKLIVVFLTYTAIVLLSLFLLYGPLRRALDPKRKKPALTMIIMILVAAAFTLPAIGAILPDGERCYFFQRWGNVWLGYVLYFFGPLLVIRLFTGLFINLPYRHKHKRRKNRNWKPSRKLSVALVLGLLLLSVGLNIWGNYAAHHVKVTRYLVNKDKLKQEQPAKIILIADLHIGVNSTIKIYEDMVERINTQKPDLVVVAGDIFTSAFGAMKDPDAYAKVLSQIQSTYGTYVVYGNHDVDEPLFGGFTYMGAENAERNPGMEPFLEKCGWKLLTDEVARIPELNNLAIIGRRDKTRPGDGVKERATLKALTEGIEPEAPVLLLEHEPAELERLDGFGINMIVAGHTHDGQVFPGNIFGRIRDPQSYGIKEWGNTTAIVTSGVGFYGPPIRVGTISEIVVIDLK